VAMKPAGLSARVWGKTMRGQTVKVLPVRPIGRRNCTCMGGLTNISWSDSLTEPNRKTCFNSIGKGDECGTQMAPRHL
jgi:hypothetical protein